MDKKLIVNREALRVASALTELNFVVVNAACMRVSERGWSESQYACLITMEHQRTREWIKLQARYPRGGVLCDLDVRGYVWTQLAKPNGEFPLGVVVRSVQEYMRKKPCEMDRSALMERA